MPDTLAQRQLKHRAQTGLLGGLSEGLMNKIWSFVEADHGTTPHQRQLQRRANTQFRLPSGVELNADIIAKIWSYVEKSMQDAAASGRRKLYMWGQYKLTLIDFWTELSVQRSGYLDIERQNWWRARSTKPRPPLSFDRIRMGGARLN